MKHRIFTALLASLIALSPMSANASTNVNANSEIEIQNTEAEQETEYLSATRSNKLYYGYISNMYPTEDNPDLMELECRVLIDGQFEEYIAYSFAEDWEVNDTILLIINDRGTESRIDDIVRDVIYISPIAD